MKKYVILAISLIIGANVMAQNKDSKVQHLTYQDFLNKVWNFEKNSGSFEYLGSVPAIIDFYADWCGPCRRVTPIMEKLAKEYDGKLNVYKINIDQEKDLAMIFQVSSIPTVLFIPMEGKPMMQVGAMREEDYRKIVKEQLLR